MLVPIHEVCSATMLPEIPDSTVDELRGLVVQRLDGGSLGLFLGNTLGDEDTKVEGKINFIMRRT
jgi:hypothetical protein